MMDSMFGADQTLPVDINGSCRLPDSMDDGGDGSPDSMTAPSFPDKRTSVKALTMKDYENQIAALKKENFNLKLRIYFMEERIQQKKAVESLASRDMGDSQRVREKERRDMDALQQALNKKIADLEQDLHVAEEEVEKMAAIAEHEKLKSLDMEKQLVAQGLSQAFAPVPGPDSDLKQALQEKDGIIEQLRRSLREHEGLMKQKAEADHGADTAGFTKREHDIGQLESTNKLLKDELTRTKSSNERLSKSLEESQNQNKTLSRKIDEKENDLCSEKKNSLKRDKTIQGLTQVLKEKEKEGAEEHQSLLMEKQAELAQLQGEHHTKVLEAQKLLRSLGRKEQELADMQQAKEQLEVELEDVQQQKKKGDKALNDLQNQLKKLSGEIRDREAALEQQYQSVLDQTNRRLQAHEVTIQRLTASVVDKEQRLQDYMNMLKEFEQNRSPGGSDIMLSKLRERLKENEKALEKTLDEKFAAIEEKDNEIHQLQLALREKERELERLNNLLAHNNETINEMAQAMLGQSQSQAHDLAQQMGERLKVTEAMLAEATKARENLVADNASAVEGLLATISSKDQLLKESSEHYNRMLSEYTREIQDLKAQLADVRQKLSTAEKPGSAVALGQDVYLEVAELRVLLAEKDGLIKKLLERGQDRDGFLSDSDHVLELRHTVHILQGRLEEREADLSKMNGEGHLTVTRTTTILKKELVQKTEALNQALKRENDLKISLAELQSMLADLKAHVMGHEANVESLTSTLETKDQIINELHLHLGQRGDRQTGNGQDQASGTGTVGEVARSPSRLPQRESTTVLPSRASLQEEHAALVRALKTEQQLFSSLIRTVKEPDSLRNNEALRDALEARLQLQPPPPATEGVDPEQLESMRHQLEDAQRWNASLQARLGAIQNRAGGVGGANDTGDTLSFLGDQTSYMSICVGEGLQEESLSLLSPQDLRQKVVELQESVSGLQSANAELQRQASLLERTGHRGDLSQGSDDASLRTRPLEAGPDGTPSRPGGRDQQSQTETLLPLQ
ncbi:hypothetical protein CRUP_022895, partial [Coryphaenoides rupestris]